MDNKTVTQADEDAADALYNLVSDCQDKYEDWQLAFARHRIAERERCAQPTQSDDNFHKLALSESFERVAKVAEERAAFNAGIEAAAKALEADAMKCDCAAREERECGCGAWCEWKSITSARAVEIVRAVKESK